MHLEDGVGTVAETNLLSNLGSVDIVYCDVVFSEEALNLVGEVLASSSPSQMVLRRNVPPFAETMSHVVHMERPARTCHEVRGGHQIGRADGLVAEAEVRAGESPDFLSRRKVGLAVLGWCCHR